jgi:hypothetical protein
VNEWGITASDGPPQAGQNELTTPGFEAYTPQLRPLSDRRYTLRAASSESENQESRQNAGPLTTPGGPDTQEKRQSFRPNRFSMRFFGTTLAGPVIVEALLPLFLGIYGVGWLMAGEIAVGIMLLIGSLLLYLPLVVVSFILAIATGGLSLLCTGPLAISAICLNAYLLHKKVNLKHKPGRPRASLPAD